MPSNQTKPNQNLPALYMLVYKSVFLWKSFRGRETIIHCLFIYIYLSYARKQCWTTFIKLVTFVDRGVLVV